ncbi:MAG: NfeD family protein [Myxococcales bacterium]|nr:NfeD family protein [Myxococcales bacterium]
MGILYLAALIIGFGTIALQLAMGGDSHGDAEVGGDADAHLDADADGDADHGHGDHGHGDHGHGDGGFLPIFLSLRFWTFTFLAFGLSGSLVHYLDLATSIVTLGMAVGLGLGAGVLASLTFRALSRSEANSGASASDAIGQVGRVLLPLGKGARGKVRIELKGQTVDYVATTDDEQLEAGQMVMIEEIRDTTAHVSRAPAELLPPKRDS